MYKAEDIRIAMARLNLKIGDVVEKSGVSRETATLVINGKADNPQLKTLEQVGRAVGLGMKVEFFPLVAESELAAVQG